MLLFVHVLALPQRHRGLPQQTIPSTVHGRAGLVAGLDRWDGPSGYLLVMPERRHRLASRGSALLVALGFSPPGNRPCWAHNA
ncbi:hypothetical protein [Nonomuraea sp. B19D2]|uniref:hypothetical protein n=1 Tax=Nonomuraea sp. B19D2 TaxID=3159561 RepID=UPI0032DB3A5D